MKKFSKSLILILAIWTIDASEISKTEAQQQRRNKRLQNQKDIPRTKRLRILQTNGRYLDEETQQLGLLESWHDEIKNGQIATFECYGKYFFNINQQLLKESTQVFTSAFNGPAKNWVRACRSEDLFIFAKLDDKVVGLAAFRQNNVKTAKLKWLAVEKEKQKLGLGKKLAFSILKIDPDISCITVIPQRGVKSFYSHIGFEEKIIKCHSTFKWTNPNYQEIEKQLNPKVQLCDQ